MLSEVIPVYLKGKTFVGKNARGFLEDTQAMGGHPEVLGDPRVRVVVLKADQP